MSYHTDERLKSYLDTNQLHREQMCLAILAIDKRFSDVRPRHPRGGPDGGRDIEAVFRNEQRACAAVGFVNQANDSEEQKKTIRKKFQADLQSALSVDPKPEVFFFLTNLNLTLTEKELLVSEGKVNGFAYCEIMDRERLRISLDSPDGFSIRFQYLGLPLSEAEQASFFARWGDDIQSVISTGFERVERTLDRLLFLQEASHILSALTFVFELDRTYSGDEIGHFRAFCKMQLKGPTHQIFGILFGSADRSNRMAVDARLDFNSQPPGIKYGISGGNWELHIPISSNDDNQPAKGQPNYQLVRSSSSVGMNHVNFITIQYTHDSFIRWSPRLTLRDIDQSIFSPVLNKSLAEKLRAIHIYSNGYKLREISRSEFVGTRVQSDIPVKFTEDELSDIWVRIMPVNASAFTMSFTDQTPKRMFYSPQTPDSLARKTSD